MCGAGDTVYSRGRNIMLRGTHAVDFCHQHNLVDPSQAGRERQFGIRVSLPAGDTMSKVLGSDWEHFHWYPSEAERDAAFEHMATRHGYYRKTDTPTQVLEKVNR